MYYVLICFQVFCVFVNAPYAQVGRKKIMLHIVVEVELVSLL